MMTVKELKALLDSCPENCLVCFGGDIRDFQAQGLASHKSIPFDDRIDIECGRVRLFTGNVYEILKKVQN